MRIMWMSNAPWANSGYGVQTRLFAPRIRDLGHDVGIAAFWGLEGAVIPYDGIPVFPKMTEAYGIDCGPAHAKDFEADLLITLVDAWVLPHEKMQADGMKWAPWFPIDHHDAVPPAVLRQVTHAFQPIVFAKHAEALCLEAGLSPLYVPHGVDTKLYYPADREMSRERIQVPKDAFVVAVVAANKGYPARKAWGETVAAFKALHDRHSDAVLYMHTHMGTEMQGMNLAELVERSGLPAGCVFAPNQYRNQTGRFDDAFMRAVYSAADVLVNASMGEGFGVPILEAQACGTPVIVGDWTSMSELCFAGWKISREDAHPTYTVQAATQYTPSIGAIVDCLRQAYLHAEDGSLPEKARLGAQAYDADHVTDEHWRPALEQIAERMEVPAELPAPEVVAA